MTEDYKYLKKMYKKHGFYHKGDSGIDIFFTKCYKLEKNTISKKLSLETRCQIVDCSSGTVLSYFLIPRSSISKTPLILKSAFAVLELY